MCTNCSITAHNSNKADSLFSNLMRIVGILLLSSPLMSQTEETPEVGFMGIYYDNSIQLRWAPATFEAFRSALAEGFSLERGLFAQQGEILSQASFESSITLLEALIVPIDEEDWSSVNISSSLRDAAMELFYNFEYTPTSVDSVNVFSALEEGDNKQTLVALASIIADRDILISTALGWAYKDGSIDPGSQYVYILTSLDDGEKYYTLVSTEESYEFQAIPKPTAVGGDSIVRLSFDKLGIEDYYGYLVQRSSDNGQTFETITEAPVYYEDDRTPNLFNFIDSLPDNANVYVFRIAGVTPFGLQSEWSDTVTVQGNPGPLDAAPEISSILTSGTGVDIEFEFPVEMESRILGFEVIRSLDRSGPFLNLTEDFLSPSTREFHDDDPLHSNFYFVRAIDENGYPLLSIPIYYAPKDSMPASIPENLTGTIDNSNQAQITWSPSPEFDIKGYKIYGSNDLNGLFVEITPGTITDTFYLFKLGNNVLNSDWYIQIKSIDQNENESALSEPVYVARPDLFAPSAPVLKDLNAFSFGVAMNWELSKSPDVVIQKLQRKETSSNTWIDVLDITNAYQGPILTNGWATEVVSGKPPSFDFIDSTAQPQIVYNYRLLAVDEANNVASSAVLEAMGYDNGIRGEIYDLMAVDKPFTIVTTSGFISDKDRAAIAVGWNYTDSMTVHHFIIYRSADNWPYKAYNSYLVYEGRQNPAATTDNAVASAVSSGLNTRYVILDKDVKPGTNYRYKIVAKHLDGGFSGMSEVVSVTTSN